MDADRDSYTRAQAVVHQIEDSVQDAIDDAAKAAWRAGVLSVLDELERLDLADEIAGRAPLDDACRRLRREVTT